MKTPSLNLLLFLTICFTSTAQTTRYFEFSTTCGHGNWQDTTFIASTSDQVVIDSVLANLARPDSLRNFISGNIGYGNGGFNHNASHWFLWHFIHNQWNLVELAIEVCDGCPYSDLDADTSYWVGLLGQYCPWSGRPVREVANPVGINEPALENEILIYPNPAKDNMHFKWNSSDQMIVTIFNSIGQALSTILLSGQSKSISIANFHSGLYFLKISDGRRVGVKKFFVE